MATILAVDKDRLQLEFLSFLLEHDGHRVHTTDEGGAALDIVRSELIDLVIVETALQRQDGLRICEQIHRLSPRTPLMILSERREEEQICHGLLAAADDYIVKPFSPRQLLARVHALLRRAKLSMGSWPNENLAVGEVQLDLQQMQAHVNGQHVPLTHRELSLLHTLMTNANQVLSRDQLMGLSWGENFVGTAKAVDVYVLRLRRKLRPHLQNGFHIRALRGFGYKLEAPLAQILASSSLTPPG
jgi:two-component system, OmpR family, alkaline phosphatase synthesis response regulator PhoP